MMRARWWIGSGLALLLVARLSGDAGGSFFTGFDFVSATENGTTPYTIATGDGENANVVGAFLWNPNYTFEEVVSGTTPTITGGSLANVDPYDHVQPAQRSLRLTSNGDRMTSAQSTAMQGALSAVTLNMQVKRSSAPNRTQYLAYRANGFALFCSANGTVTFGIYAGGSWTTMSTTYNSLPVSQWHQIRGTYDGSYMYLYIDGALKATAQKSGTLGTDTGSWHVGGYGTQLSTLGDITDVWVSKEVLHPRREPVTLASWSFAQGSGSTLPSEIQMPSLSPEDATLTGSAAFVDDADLPGRALELYGASDRAEISGTATSRVRGLSVGGWIYLDSAPSTYGLPLGKLNNFAILMDANGALTCTMKDALGTWRQASTAGVRTIALDEWHHVACVSDGDRLRTYIDGKFVTETTGVQGIYTGTDDGSMGYSGYPFPGRIAGTFVYDRAIDPDFGTRHGLARYNWRTTHSQTILSEVDGYGEATINGTSWVSAGPDDSLYKSLDIANGTISIDGRALAGPQDFTIQMWFRLDEAPSSAALLATREDAFDLTVLPDRTLTWTVKVPRVAQPTVYDSYTVDSEENALELEAWHHVAGRFRTTGGDMSVELWLDGFLLGLEEVPYHRQRDMTASDDICVGSCTVNSPLSGLVTLVDLDTAEPSTHIQVEPPVSWSCDRSLPIGLHRDCVGGGGFPCESGVIHWYAKDSAGAVCEGDHPIILVQGQGQEDASWYICTETPAGGVVDIMEPYQTRWPKSLAGAPADCETRFTDAHERGWCPDMVTVLTRDGGLDVITIDFEKAMADFNAATPDIPYDKNWMIPAPTETKASSGTPRTFPQYKNFAEYVKGADAVNMERARRGHPLENAYMLSLIIEYLYNDYAPTEDRKPVVIGHSMGGLVANMAMVSRSWSEVSETTDPAGNTMLYPVASQPGCTTPGVSNCFLGRDAAPNVHAVITLGSPHAGSKLLNLGNIVYAEGFGSSNFGDVFDEWEKEDNWVPLNGGPDDVKKMVWRAFKTAAEWGVTPSTEVMVPDEVPSSPYTGWNENYREPIDDAMDAAFGADAGVPHYQVAGMYNAKWDNEVFPGATCRRLPASEAKRTFYKSVAGGLLTAKISFVSETLAPWHADIRDRDAQRRECVDCNVIQVDPWTLECACGFGECGAYPLELCETPDHMQYQCRGNWELPQTWRLLSQQRGWMEKFFKSMGLGDIVDGRGFYDVHGDGDDFAFGYNLKSSVIDATGLDFSGDPTELNDGAVRVEEALALPTSGAGAYAQDIVGVVPKSCNDGTAPYTDVGLYLNHHQLRTGRVLNQKICSPGLGGCTPIKLLQWLRFL